MREKFIPKFVFDRKIKKYHHDKTLHYLIYHQACTESRCKKYHKSQQTLQGLKIFFTYEPQKL